MEEKKIIAYKGFDKNLNCRGFQYEVGKEYEMDGDIKCCERGFHACESPLEVFDYYDMLNSRFAEVEHSGEIDKEENTTKVCSSRIKVKAELKLADIINLGVEWIKEVTSPTKVEKDDKLNDNRGYSAKIASSGYYARIGSSGNYAQIGSSGYSAQIASSGNSAQIGSSGNSAQIANSGDCAQIVSSGDYAKIGNSGYYAKIGNSGDCAQIVSSGYSAQIASSGDYAQIASSGDSAQIGSSGEHSVVFAAGHNSIAKAKIGSWITLTEWEYNDGVRVPICVKTEQVDGERVKADTFYKLIDGEFKEVEE